MKPIDWLFVDNSSHTYRVWAINHAQAVEKVTDLAFTERLKMEQSKAEALILTTDIARFQRELKLLGTNCGHPDDAAHGYPV